MSLSPTLHKSIITWSVLVYGLFLAGAVLGSHAERVLEAGPHHGERGGTPLLQARGGVSRLPVAARVHRQEGVQGRALPPRAGAQGGGGAPVGGGAGHGQRHEHEGAGTLVERAGVGGQTDRLPPGTQ